MGFASDLLSAGGKDSGMQHVFQVCHEKGLAVLENYISQAERSR